MHRLKSGVDPGLWTLDFNLCMFYIEKCEGMGVGGWGLGGCSRVRVRAQGVQEQTHCFLIISCISSLFTVNL